MIAETASESAFPGRVEPGMSFGAYEVLLCIARGGMATVWAARQHGARGFNRLVALKTVLPELAEPEFETMFLDEARVAARIHHPNVCEIFELVEHEGMLALSMEWVDGETLNTILDSRGHEPLEPRVAAHIIAQVACGLHAAHELKDENGLPMQLVHRDVSPQNVLISRAGHVKVTDFGVAKALGGSREDTEVGRVKGKLSYMSPEQAESKAVDRRSDVFALGVVLYLATVGFHPFRRANENRDQQYMRLLVGDFRPPSSIVAGYPDELEAIVLRAMSRDPAARFATADEMRCRLQEWLVRSGPLLTEQHIARAVAERVGKTIEARAERIQRCMRQRRRNDKLDRVSTGSELTFLPTTSGASAATWATWTGARWRRAPRWLAAGAGLLLLAVAGTLSLSGGDEPSRAPEAASVPGPTSVTEPATVTGPTSDTRTTSPAPTPAPVPVESPSREPPPKAPAPTPAAAPTVKAPRRGSISLPDAMARALAERRERERKGAQRGSKAAPAKPPTSGPSAARFNAALRGSSTRDKPSSTR